MLSVFITPWQNPTACHCASRWRCPVTAASRFAHGGCRTGGSRTGKADKTVNDVVGQGAQFAAGRGG